MKRGKDGSGNGAEGAPSSDRIDYAPEWITKSIDKVPPSDEPLGSNVIFDRLVEQGRNRSTGNGSSNGHDASLESDAVTPADDRG